MKSQFINYKRPSNNNSFSTNPSYNYQSLNCMMDKASSEIDTDNLLRMINMQRNSTSFQNNSNMYNANKNIPFNNSYIEGAYSNMPYMPQNNPPNIIPNIYPNLSLGNFNNNLLLQNNIYKELTKSLYTQEGVNPAQLRMNEGNSRLFPDNGN